MSAGGQRYTTAQDVLMDRYDVSRVVWPTGALTVPGLATHHTLDGVVLVSPTGAHRCAVAVGATFDDVVAACDTPVPAR